MQRFILIASTAIGLVLVAWGLISLSHQGPEIVQDVVERTPLSADELTPEEIPETQPDTETSQPVESFPPLPPPPELPSKVSGIAWVGEAATLTVDGVSVTLDGLKPPREDADCRRFSIIYQCTLVSRGELVRITAGKNVECELARYGEDDRVWGTCWTTHTSGQRDEGPNINEQLVRAGWAFADVMHTDKLVAAEKAAKDDAIGLWNTYMRYPPPGTDAFGGRAEIRDAGGVEVREVDIRLLGIDAPDVNQTCRLDGVEYPCGVIARAYAIGLTAGKELFCNLQEVEMDDRRWGLCSEAMPGGRDAIRDDALTINELMVRAGWAVAKPLGNIDFSESERAARAEGLGLWAGEFVGPTAWRLGKRLP